MIPETPDLPSARRAYGIYIGNGEVVQAANTKAGVIRNKLEDTGLDSLAQDTVYQLY